MRRLFTAALALALLPLQSARADWPPTRWGMTPEEVLKTMPGSAPVTGMTEDDDIGPLRQKVSVPFVDNGFETTAEFYFDKQTNKLGGVRFKLTQLDRCGDYDAMLTRRYGEGKREVDTSTGRITSVDWGKPGGDWIDFAHLQLGNGETFLCLLMIRKPYR